MKNRLLEDKGQNDIIRRSYLSLLCILKACSVVTDKWLSHSLVFFFVYLLVIISAKVRTMVNEMALEFKYTQLLELLLDYTII